VGFSFEKKRSPPKIIINVPKSKKGRYFFIPQVA